MWNRERSERNLFDRPAAELAKTVEPARPEPPKAEPPVRAEAPPPRAPESEPRAEVARRPATTAPTPAAVAAPAAPKGSTLGPTLRFKGDLVADEDLVVQGQLEGSILHSRSLTIGADGSMTGDIRARRIVVEGRVEGDLYALECVTVRATGRVRGSIYAPRVALAEGAEFNGRVDMEKAPHVPAIPAPGVVAGTQAAPVAGTYAATPATAAGPELGDVEVDGLLAARDD